MESTLTYRPPAALKWAVLTLLAITAGINGVSLVFDLLEYRLATEIGAGLPVSQERINANDQRQMMLGISFMCAYLVTSVVFLCTLFRLHKNAQALGVRNMRYSAGWTVGYFFIPILNLFRPFQAVNDLWKASVPASGNWKNNPSSPLLGIWWALWIISNILGRVVFRFSLNVETPEDLQNADIVSIVATCIDIPLTIAAMVLLVRLMRMQDEKFKRFGESDGSHMNCPACGEKFAVGPDIEDCPMCGAPLLVAK